MLPLSHNFCPASTALTGSTQYGLHYVYYVTYGSLRIVSNGVMINR